MMNNEIIKFNVTIKLMTHIINFQEISEGRGLRNVEYKIFCIPVFVTDVMEVDPRTMNVLQSHLPDTSASALRDLCAYLVPSEVYHDDITHLQDQVTSLQQTLATRMYSAQQPHREKSSVSSDGGSGGGDSTPVTPTRGLNGGGGKLGWQGGGGVGGSVVMSDGGWDVPTQTDDIRELLKEKDAIIHRKDEEYGKLRRILADTQNDMQSVLDLNSQYLTIISQLNQMQMSAINSPGNADNDGTMSELEQQMEEAQEHIAKLQAEITDITSQLDTKQVELDKALKREKKYKEMLGLDMKANEVQVMDRIRKLMDGGKMTKDELDKIKNELGKATKQRQQLAERVVSLEREKEKMEFHIRQQDLSMKKISRQRTAKETLAKARSTLKAGSHDPRLSTQLRLPSIERPESGISLCSTRTNTPQYCMFCRSEFTPLKTQLCRVHYRPIRHRRYTCCRDECHRSAGCLQLPHFYIEITVDKKIFLTDGARYMELSTSS